MLAEKFLGADSTDWVSLSTVAKKVDVSPSYFSQLYAKGRIPEARKAEGGRTLVPNGRCILPPENPNYSDKISKLYLTQEEVDQMNGVAVDHGVRVVSSDEAIPEVSEDFTIGDLSDRLNDIATDDHVRGIIVFVKG